jgi:hypothetical protein
MSIVIFLLLRKKIHFLISRNSIPIEVLNGLLNNIAETEI